MEELFHFFGELGKGRRGEGEKESQKSESSNQLPSPIERRLIIQWCRMSKSKEDEENKKQDPTRVVEYGNEGHDNYGNEEYKTAFLSKEGIGNVTSVQLPDRQEVEGRYEKTHPSCITDGMKKNVIIFRNLTHHDTLDQREK
jgi:hypothetical protein